MRKWAISVFLLLFVGCAASYDLVDIHVSDSLKARMIEEYNPFIEKGFCLYLNPGSIENVLTGTPFSCAVPICRFTAIVMHSHAFFSEPWPSFIDGLVWDEYTKRYGNDTFGVLGFNYLHFYRKGSK
jgi:hypothetical protein